MPYTHFQYIAYQIPTVAEDDTTRAAIYGLPSVAVGNPPPLAGDLRNLSVDAKTRIERLIGAMKLAEAQIHETDNNNTLKIFLAPEFYFRPADPADPAVSYTCERYRAIKNVLQLTISGDDRFRHWLVVPGTIMWVSDPDVNTLKRPNPNRWVIFYNSAIYVYGGGHLSHVIEKAMASPIDGIPTANPRGNPLFYPDGKSTDEAFGLKYRSDAKRRKHLFTIEGVHFGLDICLEHGFQLGPVYPLDMRITKHAVIDNWPRGRVQIHLLTAGGMDICPRSVAASQGGYILRNDGFSNQSTNCQQIRNYLVDGTATSANDPAGSADLDYDVGLAATIDINARHELYLPAPANADLYWAHHPQQIKIYHICHIP